MFKSFWFYFLIIPFFITYTLLIVILYSTFGPKYFFKETDKNILQKVYYKHYCISLDRLCIFYKYTHDEKLRIRASIRPGKKYLPSYLIPNYEFQVNLWENNPLTPDQSKKFKELSKEIFLEYEKHKFFNIISDSKFNEFTIHFRDENDFNIYAKTFNLSQKDDVISSDGKYIAYQFESEDEISSNLFSKIDHSEKEIRWSNAFVKELDFLEESY